MQITVVVCDRCKARHELNQDTEEHGHAGPWRLPPGWAHIQTTKAPMVGKISGAEPESVEPEAHPNEVTPEQRAMAVTGLKHFIGMLEDPSVDAKTAKALMRSMVDQFSMAVDFDETSIGSAYRRYDGGGHGEHLPLEARGGVFCGDCIPTMTAADGTPFVIPVTASGYGTITATPLRRGFPGTRMG